MHQRRHPPLRTALTLTAALLSALPLHAQTPTDAAQAMRAVAGSHSPALKSTTPVTVNFVNADVDAVTRAMAAMIQRQILLDPRVKGTMTVYSEQPLTVREAYLNYLAALRGLGFTMVENGGLLKVVPEAEAKLQSGTVSIGDVKVRGDQVITQIFPLNYENPNSLVPVLRPLISANNTINANPGSNSLVITDYADNLQRIAKIIAALDQPASTGVEVVPLKYGVAGDMAPIVQRLADGGGGAGPVAPGLPAGTHSLQVMVDPRSNSLILRASNSARMAAALSIIDKLDQPTAGGTGSGNIWVVYLKNADAVKLAAVLRAAYSASGAGALGGNGNASLGGGGASLTTPTSLQGTATAAGASPSATPVAASPSPSTGGFIQADPSTNALIITAPEPLYRQLRNVIEQLDTRRAQIYIETLIVKVDADKAADLGIQWQALSGNQNSSQVVAGGTNYGDPNIVNLTTAINSGASGLAAIALPPGLNVGVLKKIGDLWNIGALAHFLETKADANVLATPNLVALDNEEAKIVVGQNVPFVTGSFTTNASGANNPFQTIERKDVGLTLRIKAQIGEGGTIRLVIYHENSSVVASTRNSPQGVTTDKSAIETTVVIDDGQLMVLGGLLKDEYGGSVDQVPYLGDVPVVGALFRSDSRTRTKSNLMVFLRPIIIRNQDDSNALSLDRYDLMRDQQQQFGQPRPNSINPITTAPLVPPALSTPLGEPAMNNGRVPPPLARPGQHTPAPPADAASAPSVAPPPPQRLVPLEQRP